MSDGPESAGCAEARPSIHPPSKREGLHAIRDRLHRLICAPEMLRADPEYGPQIVDAWNKSYIDFQEARQKARDDAARRGVGSSGAAQRKIQEAEFRASRSRLEALMQSRSEVVKRLSDIEYRLLAELPVMERVARLRELIKRLEPLSGLNGDLSFDQEYGGFLRLAETQGQARIDEKSRQMSDLSHLRRQAPEAFAADSLRRTKESARGDLEFVKRTMRAELQRRLDDAHLSLHEITAAQLTPTSILIDKFNQSSPTARFAPDVTADSPVEPLNQVKSENVSPSRPIESGLSRINPVSEGMNRDAHGEPKMFDIPAEGNAQYPLNIGQQKAGSPLTLGVAVKLYKAITGANTSKSWIREKHRAAPLGTLLDVSFVLGLVGASRKKQSAQAVETKNRVTCPMCNNLCDRLLATHGMCTNCFANKLTRDER